MSTIATSPRQTKYPPRILAFARRLRDEGDYTINEIREALRKRGYEPKRDTVRYWVDDEYREEKLRRQRRFAPPGPPAKRGWQKRLERMKELRELRVSYKAIANLMSHDFGLEVNEAQVREIFHGQCSVRRTKSLLGAPGVKP